MRRPRTPAVLVLALFAFACSGSESSPESAPAEAGVTTDPAADVEAIMAQSRRFSQAYVDGDLDTQMAIYSDDAVIAPPGRGFISGPENLRRYWTTPEGREVVRHSSTPVDIVVQGDVAYDWGIYQGASGPVGAASDFEGKYLIVWRRGDDGVWRMVQDMWNTSS